MPVLPLVASMSASPGLMRPRFSAPTTMERAGRSFTEPAGLLPSSFAKSKFGVLPGMRCRRTSGVLPTKWSRVGFTRRQERKAPHSAGLRARRNGSLLLLRVFLRFVGLLLGGRLLLVRLFLRGLRLRVGLRLLGLLLRVGFRFRRFRLVGLHVRGLFLDGRLRVRGLLLDRGLHVRGLLLDRLLLVRHLLLRGSL